VKRIFPSRALGLALVILSLSARAQTLTDPPPPPPEDAVDANTPLTAPPPPPTDVEPQPEVQLPKEVEDENYSRVRFAPTAKAMLVGINGGGPIEGVVVLSSLRAGLRASLTPRRPERYAWGVGLALELGLEGLGVLPQGQQAWGMGLTLKFGPAAVTRGGLYFPYVDFYLLYTAVPSRFGFAQKFGAGLNFNLVALLSADDGSGKSGFWGGNGGGSAALAALAVLSLVMPAVELVWTPATTWFPWSTLEVRFGVGF
jgi:hypothetical protein